MGALCRCGSLLVLQLSLAVGADSQTVATGYDLAVHDDVSVTMLQVSLETMSSDTLAGMETRADVLGADRTPGRVSDSDVVPAEQVLWPNGSHLSNLSRGVRVPVKMPAARLSGEAKWQVIKSSKDIITSAWDGATGVVDDAVDAVTGVVDDAVGAAKETGEKAIACTAGVLGLLPKEHANSLGGHEMQYMNKVVCLLALFFLSLAGCGAFVDKCIPLWKSVARRPSAMTVFLLVGSYALLIPALTEVLFSFNLYGVFNYRGCATIRINLSKDKDTQGAITESIISAVGDLFDAGAVLAAILLLFYAIVVPVVKLACLVLGEVWRTSPDPSLVIRSRRLILFLHHISKWAAPDLLVYIFMLYLFRSLNHEPELKSDIRMDVGFMYFGAFVVGSTLTTLAVHPPELPEDEGVEVEPPWFVKHYGWSAVAPVTNALAVVFVVLLTFGLFIPCMAMRLDTVALEDAKMNLDKDIVGVDVEELFNVDVSLASCIGALLTYSKGGELVSCFALTILIGFVVCLSLASMFSLVFAARHVSAIAECDASERPSCAALDHSREFMYTSMLDVFIVGVLVFCLSAAGYDGVTFLLRLGIVPLLGAEVAHYAAYYIVTSAGYFLTRASVAQKEAS